MFDAPCIRMLSCPWSRSSIIETTDCTALAIYKHQGSLSHFVSTSFLVPHGNCFKGHEVNLVYCTWCIRCSSCHQQFNFDTDWLWVSTNKSPLKSLVNLSALVFIELLLYWRTERLIPDFQKRAWHYLQETQIGITPISSCLANHLVKIRSWMHPTSSLGTFKSRIHLFTNIRRVRWKAERKCKRLLQKPIKILLKFLPLRTRSVSCHRILKFQSFGCLKDHLQ